MGMLSGEKARLWQALSGYQFEHLVPTGMWDHILELFGGENACTQAFADKLCRKLKWKRGFALRAIGEYKKFLYLGRVSTFAVTPSRVLDQVWHEHLLFTRAYHEFCKEVLGKHFEHNPELVPVDEQTSLFRRQYQATLELYRHEFGAEPPAAIWAVPKFDRYRKGGQDKEREGLDLDLELPHQPPNSARLSRGGGDGSTWGPLAFGDDEKALHVILAQPHIYHLEGFTGFEGGRGGGAGAAGSWSVESHAPNHAHSAGMPVEAGSDGGDTGDGGGSGCSSGCGGD